MPLPSFLQRFRRDGQAPSAADLGAAPGLDVEAARTRARRRLIGMLVLVVAGVLGFPWLFETQPRPMSQDVQVVQAPGQGSGADAAAPASGNRAPLSGRVGVAGITPPVASAQAPTTDAPQAAADGGQPEREIVETEETPAASAPKAAVTQAPAKVAAVLAQPKGKPAASAPAAKPTAPKVAEHKDADRKAADKKPADKKPEPSKDTKAADKADTRYVVQFGAFADTAAAQAARAKVEKLGIKTYAQTVDTPAGKRTRVRIGPFANKAEAEKANAALRKAGLTGSVLTL